MNTSVTNSRNINPAQAYQKLVERSRELNQISSITNLASWDQEVYMPPGGSTSRAEMVSFTAKLYHQKLTETRFGELLKIAAGGKLTAGEAANLREWQREYEKGIKLPDEFVVRAARLYSESFDVWQKAKRQNNYALFAPKLAEIIQTVREEAHYLSGAQNLYDALLDKYEEGLTTAQCDAFFAQVKATLVPILQKVQNSNQKISRDLFKGASFNIEKQRAFGQQVSAALGFNYNEGRLDVSEHPFTNRIDSGDVRITTAYHEKDPLDALLSTVHESGHGIYEQGLLSEHRGTPLGNTSSMSIHESQSRFFENYLARSRPFWEYWLPKFKEIFPSETTGIGFEEFYRFVNRIEPSLIRTRSDEFTYHLHIIIRFEIERDLINGCLDPAQLREVWNQKYKSYLGVDVPDDAAGVLQDVHWSWGSFGYFPTYSFGSAYAAQFAVAMRRDIPALDESISKCEFSAPTMWLRVHVHQYGCLYTPAELIKQATGKPFDVSDFLNYLKTKFKAIYGE
jgi:carboxypeptidase Taq